MPRLARIVAPGFPHHVTQRGNRRQQTFFGTDDYEAYVGLMAHWCRRCGVEVWAYCLMPNHAHLIVVPQSEDGLRRAIGEAHRRYTRRVNFRQRWRGHLWQGRFASFAMDEEHLLMAARYVELNPVRARLAKRPDAYRWSSAAAHLAARDDALVKVTPLLERVADWSAFLAGPTHGTTADPRAMAERLRRHERTGRPLGSGRFMDRLEVLLGRVLRPKKRGPKPSEVGN
jgi:putative transposase